MTQPLEQTHPKLAKQAVNKTLAKILPATSRKPIEWECELGHHWEAPIRNRAIQNAGCPYCGRRKVLAGFNDLATTHPDIAAELVDPDIGKTILSGSKEKQRWHCDKGHVYEASPAKRTRAEKPTGCPFCSNKKVLVGFNDIATTHPDIAKLFKNPEDAKACTAFSSKIIKTICPRCGNEFNAKVATITNGAAACPHCCERKAHMGKTDLATVRPDIAKELVDQTLATKLTAGSSRKVEWRCFVCGETWFAPVTTRTHSKHTCPHCKKAKRLAKTANIRPKKKPSTIVTIPTDSNVECTLQQIAKEFPNLSMVSQELFGQPILDIKTAFGPCRLWVADMNHDYRCKTKTLAQLVSPTNLLHGHIVVTASANKTNAHQFICSHALSIDYRTPMAPNILELHVKDELVAALEFDIHNDTCNIQRYVSLYNPIQTLTLMLDYIINHHNVKCFEHMVDNDMPHAYVFESLGFVNDETIEPSYMLVGPKTNWSRKPPEIYPLHRFQNDPGLRYRNGWALEKCEEKNQLYRIFDSGKTRWRKRL